MQIINASVFEAKSKPKVLTTTDDNEELILQNFSNSQALSHDDFAALLTTKSKPIPCRPFSEVTVDGLRFHVIDGGNKLSRIRGELP